MKFYCEAIGKNVFEYLPLTFHVQNGKEDKEYKKFKEFYLSREQQIQEIDKQINEIVKSGGNANHIKRLRNIWIIKPGEVTNRGNGINVYDKLSEIDAQIDSQATHPNGKQKTYIVQLYIDRPLLFNRRKFDIRCYILMTSINGILKGIK